VWRGPLAPQVTRLWPGPQQSVLRGVSMTERIFLGPLTGDRTYLLTTHVGVAREDHIDHRSGPG